MNIKRKTLLALTGLTREAFDKGVRYDQFPFLAPTDGRAEAHLSEELKEERSGYTLSDAFQIVVAQDLARSYWHEANDLKGASRVVRNIWHQIASVIDQIETNVPSEELWIGVILRRSSPGQIAEEEVWGHAKEAAELLAGIEPCRIGTLPQIMQTALAVGEDGETEVARVAVVNVSAAYRLLKARAHRHAIKFPENLDWMR